MLYFQTNLVRQAEYSRDRRNRLSRFKSNSWFNPALKIATCKAAYRVSDWPVDEFAVIAALVSGIGLVGLVVY